MKKTMKRVVSLLLILYAAASQGLAADEVGLAAAGGNYGFKGLNAGNNDFKDAVYWNTSLYYKTDKDESRNLSWAFSLKKEPILGALLQGELCFQKDWYSITLGPSFSLYADPWAMIKAGLNSKIMVEWPGIIFAEAGGSVIPESFGGNGDGSYSSSLSAGFYLSSAYLRCYITQDIKSSHSQDKNESNSYKSYIFHTDFYRKNSIFKLRTKLGYEILKKDRTTQSFEMKNVLFGLRTDFSIKSKYSFYVELDNKIFPSSTGKTKIKSLPPFMGSLGLGFCWFF